MPLSFVWLEIVIVRARHRRRRRRRVRGRRRSMGRFRLEIVYSLLIELLSIMMSLMYIVL